MAAAMTTTAFTAPNRPLTWLITGCSSGMGLALARHVLAQRKGHTLIATSRNPSRTPELVAEIEGQGGRWLALDVTDPHSGRVVSELEAGGTHVDVLVNNAGEAVLSPVELFDDDEVRAQMELLFLGPYRLIRAAVPYMRRRRFGVVVNFSSGAGLEGRETMGVYAAGKAALDGLTKVLAKEIAPFNVRALYVTLGGFDTRMQTQVVTSRVPLDPDYRDTTVGQMLAVLAKGTFTPDGDPVRAMKAVYEVVVGEGVGAGREAEIMVPLGRDMVTRVEQVVGRLNHAMEVFGDVCRNVYKEKETKT